MYLYTHAQKHCISTKTWAC